MRDQSTPTNWKEAVATVVSSTYHYARLRDLSLDDYVDRSFFVICFTYVVDGQTFEDKFEQWESLDPGHKIAITYNPQNPAESSLSKPKQGILFRAVVWSLGIALAALMIYLQRRFNIPDSYNFPTN